MVVVEGFHTKVLKKGDPAPSALTENHARLFSNRFDPKAASVVLYLTKKEIAAEIVNIHPLEAPEWYYKINSEGEVPVFEHNGQRKTGTLEIFEYLDHIYPESSILPKDPEERQKQKETADRLESIEYRRLLAAARNDPSKAEMYKEAEQYLITAEELLKDNFYAGSKPGYPDYLAFPFLEVLLIMAHLGHPNESFLGAGDRMIKYIEDMTQEVPEVDGVVVGDKIWYWDAYLKGEEISPDMGLTRNRPYSDSEDSEADAI